MACRSRAITLLIAILSVSTGLAAAQDTRVIDVYFPQPIPLFAGGVDPSILNQMYGTALVDVAYILPMYFHRPIDDLTPRPGAQSLAMGGAYIAQAQNALALGWNPGGLGRVRSAEFMVDGILRSSSSSTKDLPDTIFIEGQPEFQVRDYEVNLGSSRQFGFLGGAMPLVSIADRPIVGGAAYRRHTDVCYGEQTVLSMGLFDAQTFPFTMGMDNEERGSIESFTVGFGYQPLDLGKVWLSLGATGNSLSGRLASELTTRVSVRGYDEGHLNYRVRYKGFSGELGVLAGYGDLVRAGAWYGLPHTLNVHDGKFTSMPVRAPNALEIYRLHGTVADYDLEVPAFMSAGIAIGPIRGIELSADVNHRPWSDAKIKHSDADFRQFDTDYPAADVTSYHVGGRFEFPLLRRPLHRIGLRVMTMAGFRTLPLSMRDLNIFTGDAPYYFGDQVEGSATSWGLSVETRTNVFFHFGMEVQSYEFRKWFLDDTREMEDRELAFSDPYSRAPVIERSVTIMRFGTELRF